MKSHPGVTILLLSLAISLIGLIAIYDASVVEGFRDFSDKFHFVKQQLTWLFIALGFFLVSSRIPISFYQKYSTIIFLGALFFIIIVLIPGIGLKLQGARRWLNFGPFGFQPSEPFKTALVIYLSVWLEKPKPLKQFLFLISLILGLVMLQPDLGTASIIGLTSFSLYYLSGAEIKKVLSFSGILLVGLLVLIFSSSYRLDRVKTFLDPTSDQLGTSYHINQVLLGLGSGGLSGVGLGQSRQKYAYLPESTTDSIFVIIGEELGFIGSVVLIALLASFVIYILNLSLRASQKQAKLLIAGIGLLLLSQIFVNLGSMVALIPLTGVPLPLISYGGSSLVTTFISLGVLTSAARTIKI